MAKTEHQPRPWSLRKVYVDVYREYRWVLRYDPTLEENSPYIPVYRTFRYYAVAVQVFSELLRQHAEDYAWSVGLHAYPNMSAHRVQVYKR